MAKYILSAFADEVTSVFEDQLKKCGVEYFDFYLLHNVYEDSIKIYNDERWGIIDFFVKQNQRRITCAGFLYKVFKFRSRRSCEPDRRPGVCWQEDG